MSIKHSILVRDEQHLWFLEKGIPVFDILEWFSPQSISDKAGNSIKPGLPLHPVTFMTDLGWSFSAAIENGKFLISERSQSRPGTYQFLKAAGVKPGDQIQIEKLDEFTFRLCKI
ncbi:MAG: hypothetical protein L6Q77_13070 [Bacteroidetes bacterium]|nr:hypothetical protein [Bacteroidota bacterium]